MTSLPIFLRPSTQIQELDLTQRIDVILSTTGVIVGEFARGPVDPTYQSGVDEDFRALYGEIADPTISFAHDTATTFSTQSGNLLIVRRTKNALYAGLSVLLDSVGKRALMVPFTTGTPGSYTDTGVGQAIILKIGGTLAATNTFKLDITDGVTLVTTATTTYASSHNATMTSIALNIQTALDTFSVGSLAQVYNEPTGGNNSIIIIRPANNVSLDISNPVIVGNSLTATLNDNVKLFDMFAENPGEWANDYGMVMSNINEGIKERYNLTIAGPLLAANVLSMTVNGTLVTTTYATSSDTTLAAFATALTNHPDIELATVQTVAGAVDNDRSILIIAKVPGPGAVVYGTPTVTLGATQVAVGMSKVMTGLASDGSFTMQIYSRDNTNVSEENFLVSLGLQLDSRGYQQNIAQVVNRSSTKSINIRIAQPTTVLSLYNTGDPITVPDTIAWMSGGDDGVACTSAEINQGWDLVSDRVQWPFSVMLNAGYTSPVVQKYMAALAESRSDCIAILDAPSDRQGAQDLRSYRLNELDIDTSYAAMYTPDVEIADDRTGEYRFIPPSGPVGATYAYSDRLTNFVGAPAGLNRGKVNIATGLRYYYTIPEQQLLYPQGINYIQNKPKVGPVVMAEQTLQVKQTVLSSVHARRILNYIKTGLVDGLDYTLFDPNTTSTRFAATQLGKTILDPMTAGDGNGGLYGYRIQCDEKNNTDDVIDADQLAYDVYLKITRVIKGILVRAILTRTGASFDEIVL
jgi:hypothetical protein